MSQLSDKVYRALREEIESLSLLPGTHLRELEVAARFHVSRTPTRDALQRLAVEGLVEATPNRGVVVARVSYVEALQAYEVRTLVEPFAAAQAASTPAVRDTFERLLDRLETVVAEPKDEAALLAREEFDGLLHGTIARASGNQFIERIVAETRSRMRRAFRHLGGDGVFALRNEEHRAILVAILNGDSSEASAQMLNHLEQSRAGLLDLRVADFRGAL